MGNATSIIVRCGSTTDIIQRFGLYPYCRTRWFSVVCHRFFYCCPQLNCPFLYREEVRFFMDSLDNSSTKLASDAMSHVALRSH